MPKDASHMPEKLAEAAYALFAEHGMNDVTLDQVAARAGVTKGSLYCHYKSKHDLIVAACNHYYRTYHEKVHAMLAPLTDPVERLRRVLELSVRNCVVDRKSRVFTTDVWAMALQDEQIRSGWAQFYGAVREMFIGLVTAGTATGRLSAPDPRKSVNLMLDALEGVKIRASFEPAIAAPSEQEAIVDGLMGILNAKEEVPA